MEKIIVLVFALFVLLNEIMLGISEKIGVFMYLVLMSIGLILLSREILNDVGRMIIIFLMVPLVRIVGLFMDVSYIWKIFLGYGLLLFLGMYYLYEFNIDIGDVREYLWMIPIVICFGTIVGILGNVGFACNGNFVLIMALPLIIFSEEIFFRGLMQNSIEKSCGIFCSIFIPAVIYGALSIYLGIGLPILFFIVNIFSGFLYFSTKNIFLSITFSLIISTFIFVVPQLI